MRRPWPTRGCCGMVKKKRENKDKADTRKETIDADYTQAGTKRNASLKWKTNALLG